MPPNGNGGPRDSKPRDLDEDQQGGSPRDAIERIAHSDALEAAVSSQGTEVAAPPRDPAPLPSHVARDRTTQLVKNMSQHTLLELRKLRDQLDTLMTEMSERDAAICDAIANHAEFMETSLQHKQIISDSIQKLMAGFEASRSPLPGGRRL